MKKLGIITISKDSLDDICKSLHSIRALENFCTINVIYKELTSKNEEYIRNEFPSLEIKFHRQKNEGIYDAMNEGIAKINSKYIYFLNAGDECCSVNELKKAILNEPQGNKVLVFDSLQIFGNDKYLRSERQNLLQNKFKKIAHQALIVPTLFAKKNYFALNKPITADRFWIDKCLKAYPHTYIEIPLTNFYLGGISNYPTVSSVMLRQSDGGFPSSIKESVKLALRLLLGIRYFYKFMCQRKKYF